MSDILQPEHVKKWLATLETLDSHTVLASHGNMNRLCRDYLTLWERVEELRTLCDESLCTQCGQPTKTSDPWPGERRLPG